MPSEGEGVSILETESYIIALVFLIFLALFVSVEKLLEWRQANLTRRHKVGLLAALDAVKSELMLFGVASLLLNVFESPITRICIHAPSTPKWTILSQLNGCECCLRHTTSVSECFLDNQGCGTNFCNCNGADPSCLESSEGSEQCAGFSQYSVEECGNRPGYKQALTSRTITQIHIMLFYIAAAHILCSVIMNKIAAARIQIWKRWLSDDDAHTTAVKTTLQQVEEAAWNKRHPDQNIKETSASSPPGKVSVWQTLARTLSRTTSKTGFTDSARGHADEPVHAKAFDGDRGSPSASDGLERLSQTSLSQEDDVYQTQNLNDAPESDAYEGGSFNAAGQPEVQHPDVATAAAHGAVQQSTQPGTASANNTADAHHKHHLGHVKPVPGQIHYDVAQLLWHQTGSRVKSKLAADLAAGHERHTRHVHLPQTERDLCLADQAAREAAAKERDVAEGMGGRQHADTALDIHLPDEVVVEQAQGWGGRKGELDKHWQYSWEWSKCFFRQFRLQTIQHAEISIMRASFILTHRPGKSFKFMDYILASLDDDCAKVVGLGVSVWLVVIVFVLLAGVMGWAAAWFELLAVVLELIMNTKLIYIARHTARGGRVHRLKPTIFWFGARGPWVMLLVIKTLLFLVSFIFASLVFFAVNFGRKSCFFATPGVNAASLPIPWWVVLILNGIVFFAMSFVTLPLYSLGVQMGSDFRPHILTPAVKNRLLDIANANKEKVRQRKLEETARNGKYKSKYKKLSGGVAAQRWRRKHAPTSG